ncbi:MAG TPA: hypothetical protein VI636_17470 [Candidatus Angelobacter sp.]
MQKLSVIYNSGLFDVKRTSTGIIGGGFYLHRGTSQSRLSQMAAPPRKRSYLKVTLLWLVGFFLAGGAISLIRPQLLGEKHQKIYGSAPVERGAVVARQVPPDIDTTIGNVLLVGLFVLLAILLWRVHRYNRKRYPAVLQRWNSSFMCRRCGAVTEMQFQPSA